MCSYCFFPPEIKVASLSKWPELMNDIMNDFTIMVFICNRQDSELDRIQDDLCNG